MDPKDMSGARTLAHPGYPLCFRVSGQEVREREPVRFEAQVLEHMQKEGIVHCRPGHGAWRLSSDEGPLMRGTDLAPAPLPMFNAGMQFALFERIFDLGAAHGVRWEALSVELDNWYALHGSFFRGDARGSVRPSEISIRARTSAPHELACSLLRASVLASVAEAYFRTPLVNTFSLFLNGRRIVTAKARDPGLPEVDDPHLRIERVAGEGPAGGRRDAIVKIAAANIAPTPLGGTPTNLNPEQHRDIQVRGSCSAMLPGAFAQATNNLHPNGSTFRYLSAASSPEVPASVAYLAAGLGFCYMTQLHRYAVIAKVPLSAVRLVQFMPFAESGRATAFDLRVDVAPVDTTVFIEGNASVDQVLRMLAVSQQTCFLHGALHGSFPSKVRAVINDRPVDIAT